MLRYFILPSSRAGFVTATQLRPALDHQPVPKNSYLGPALVKAAYAATVLFISSYQYFAISVFLHEPLCILSASLCNSQTGIIIICGGCKIMKFPVSNDPSCSGYYFWESKMKCILLQAFS